MTAERRRKPADAPKKPEGAERLREADEQARRNAAARRAELLERLRNV